MTQQQNQLSQIAQLMRDRNPQEVVMAMIKNSNINDPMVTQLVNFAQSGDTNSLVNLANNFFQQRGLNMDQEFNNFISLLK